MATGFTAFMTACAHPEASLLPETYLMLAQNEQGCVDNDGNTGLILACKHKNVKALQSVLTIPPPFEYKHMSGEDMTALMHAASNNLTEAVSLLLKHE